jgi:uncharacterized protein YuzE
MNVIYDTRGDVYEVELPGGAYHRTVEFDENNFVDLDEDGNVIAIEVLAPEQARISEIAESFGFADDAPEILRAVEQALPKRSLYSGVSAVYGSQSVAVAAHSSWSFRTAQSGC